MIDSSNPIYYTAAGGVLINDDHREVLLLIRPARDEVRLPKGHVEPDERPEETARREVAEEAGYADLDILADLGELLVVFTLEGRMVRRTERYYLMRPRTQRRVERPAKDAQQFFIVWVPWATALDTLTFEAERVWIRRAQDALEAIL
jgi:8-oxo-dGTP pyrophosphatase MutT (NUDIX family)